MKAINFLILLCAWFASSRAFAQHQEAESPQHESHAEHFHRNHLSVFGGGTTKLESHKDTHFSLGADYVRYFPPSGRWGVSVFGEAIFAEHTEWLLGVPVLFHANKRLWLRAGPGIEIFKKEESHHEEATGTALLSKPAGFGPEAGFGVADRAQEVSSTKTETEFLMRVGAGYDFAVGTFTISPSVDFDAVRSTTSLVWGINIGKGF